MPETENNINDIPFTDENPCGPMSGHRHETPTADGWIVCTTKNIRWRAFNIAQGHTFDHCYEAHEHRTWLGYAYCDTTNRYWATSEQARVEESARSTAIVTGSVGATYSNESRKADGSLVITASATYKTVKEASK